jgi:hypothetical protein
MIHRRKAIVGAVAWWVGRRIAQRKLASAQAAVVPDGGSWQMLNRTRSAPQAVAERTTSLVEAVRPVVQRAINDPEFHAALRQAFETSREVRGQVKGKPPAKAAQRIARDRKLQRRVETSANDLKEAVAAVLQEPKRQKRKGFFRRVVTPVLVVGGVAAAVFTFMKKRGGIGPEETPY